MADPARPTAGQQVRLALAQPPADATGFAWDLAGRGVYTRHTGHLAQTELSFLTPGVHSVAVRFQTGGATRLAVLTITVASRAASPERRAAPRLSRARRATPGLSGHVTAHPAGDPGVTIADFHFSPASTTIHAGDTITWTNNGPSSHTATASNGSFNTGILKKGQSASHTFSQPGTYAYVCQIHPFMHGTIVVLASTTSTTSATTPTAHGPHDPDDHGGHRHDRRGTGRPDAPQHRLQRPRRPVRRADPAGPGRGPTQDPHALSRASTAGWGARLGESGRPV